MKGKHSKSQRSSKRDGNYNKINIAKFPFNDLSLNTNNMPQGPPGWKRNENGIRSSSLKERKRESPSRSIVSNKQEKQSF